MHIRGHCSAQKNEDSIYIISLLKLLCMSTHSNRLIFPYSFLIIGDNRNAENKTVSK